MHPAGEVDLGSWVDTTPERTYIRSAPFAGVWTTNAVERWHVRVRGRAASTRNPKDSTGWRQPSAYYGYTLQYNPGKVSGEHYWNGVHTIGQDLMVGSMDPSRSRTFPSDIADQCYQRALLKFRHREMNLAASLGEIRETRKMLRQTILSVVDVARKLRRRQFRKAWSSLRNNADFADAWLAARFGWRPLLSDLYNVAAAMDNALGSSPPTLTVRARSIYSPEPFRQGFFGAGCGSGSPYFWVEAEWDTYLAYVCRVRMDAFVLDTQPQRLVDTGIQDPLLVVWELLPYSFVVDWFLGVGSYLDGLNAMMGLQYRGGTQSRKVVEVSKLRLKAFNGKVTSFTPAEQILDRGDRSVIITPSSKLVSNGLSKMDAPHWADALALLVNVLKKG